jgi:penicillin amidase
MSRTRHSLWNFAVALAICLGAMACGDDNDVAVPTPTPFATATAVATATAEPSGTPSPTATEEPVATPTATAEPTATRTAGNPVLALPVDAKIGLPGLTSSVDVAFDSIGEPHIYGTDQSSVLFVQGYETAKVRFWEMDAFRRVAEGRLSELFGRFTLGMDAEMRTVFTTRDGQRIEEALWKRLVDEAPDAAQLAQAFSAGINAWLADLRAGRNGATLPPEYGVVGLGPEALDDWRPQDSLAIGRLQAWSLSETLGAEIAAAERVAALPDALLRDVFRSAPAAPATVLPVGDPAGGGGGAAAAARVPTMPPLETLRRVREMLDHNADLDPIGRPQRGQGSNNWIVSPELSANGFAMLANDPHLQLFNPPIWHMVQGDAGDGLRVNGVNFPGLPGVILGHNDYGAWGATVAVFDVTDVYVETITTPPDYPESPRTVLFKGEQVPVRRIDDSIRLNDGTSVPLVIEVVPHHGPMVPDPDLDDGVDGLAATGMSFRWTGHEVTLDSLFLNQLNRARNVDEFKEAIRHFAVGAQNWVWADIHGDIAYFPYVLVPQRPEGTVPYLPMPGTGEAEWLQDDQGDPLWLPEDEFPQALNPPLGYLATANNDQIGNTLDNDPLDDPIYLTFTADLGFREQRIQDMLSNRAKLRPEGAKITMADMSAYQYDTVSLEASRLVPFLFAAADDRPDLLTPAMADAIERLRAWGTEKSGSPAWRMTSGIDPAEERDDVTPRAQPVTDEERADAVASSIFAAWSTRLGREVFADDFAGTGIGVPGGDDATKALLHILEDTDRTDPGFVVHTKGDDGQSTLWDDKNTPQVETRDETLLAALADGLDFLQSKFGSSDPESWLWGKIHQVRFQHFFGQAGIPTFDLGNFAAPGGRFTVNVADYSLNSDDFVFSAGPSQRFVAVLDPSGVRAVNILPGGNNGNPGSADAYNRIDPDIHYGDLVPGWIDGSTFEYRVSRQAVADDTQLHLRYVPGGNDPSSAPAYAGNGPYPVGFTALDLGGPRPPVAVGDTGRW